MKSLIVLLFCCVFVVSACGDDQTSTSDDPADEPDPNTGEPDPGTSAPNPTTSAGDDGPLGAGPYPVGEVAFVVTNPDGSTTEYSVSCLGDTATVLGDIDSSNDTIGSIRGDEMCLSLADPEVQRRLIDGEPADQACTEIFGSAHTAQVDGTIDGTEFSTTFHRSNGCGIDDWDTVMADLLPPV